MKKKYILGFFALGITSLLSAQITANAYLNRAPSIPDKVCQFSGAQQDAFTTSVKELSAVIDEDAENRKKEVSEYADSHQAEMEAGVMRNSGLSQSDIKKAKNGKELSKAEQMELANKMVQQNSNMSLDEAKNLGKMNKAGQESWAQGYASEQMAMAQSGSGQNQGANQAGKNLYELVAEQTDLRNQLTTRENSLRQKYITLDQEAQSEKALLEKELQPLRDELNKINDGEGSTQADVNHAKAVISQIHQRQDRYCEKFTPRLIDFLEQYKANTEAAIPDYDRLEDIQAQVTAAQTNTKPITVGKGLFSIQAVGQYLGFLAEASRYKLYQPEK
ncbi:MAG: hypothetical protein WCR72_06040 [Bacteroidota bacterium]